VGGERERERERERRPSVVVMKLPVVGEWVKVEGQEGGRKVACKFGKQVGECAYVLD
jgi:hypothetical protein